MKTSLAVGFDKIGFMLVLLLALMVWSGIAPADRTVWMVESVWSIGLLTILLVTRKWFKFSTAAFFAVMTTVAMAGLSQTLKCCHGVDEWYGM